MLYKLLTSTLLCLPTLLLSQEISISSDLNIRGYFSYDVLGYIDDRILVYRDHGFTKEIDVFNEELEHTMYAEIFFEKKKVDVFDVTTMDSVFQIMYGFFEQDSMHFMMKRYDKSVVLRDSMTFIKLPKSDIRRRISSVISEDKGKILFYTVDSQERLVFVLFDNEKKKMLWTHKVFVNDTDIRNDLMEVRLLNSGEFLLVLRDEGGDREDDLLSFIIFNPFTDGYKKVRLAFEGFYRQSYMMDIDNLNDRIIICGTYAEREGKETLGYYFINTPLAKFSGNERVYFYDFNDGLQHELLQGRRKKSKIFDDIQITEIINRKDGGFLVISELTREFSRRNPYNNTYARSAYGGYTRRGWIDYYNDDIIITSFNAANQFDWSEVLYKKQFSQDDEAVYSSFFVMKTPSRMRIIYNDEIKKNNTVSEYILDPAGNLARNSLLSTEYEDMRLRFRDAIQINSNSILVPSEKNYNLNLVRITY